MNLRADGVIGVAGCCIAVDVEFKLQVDADALSSDSDIVCKGHVYIRSKETLSYYDLPKFYAHEIHLICAELDFKPIEIDAILHPQGFFEALIQYLYIALERTDAMGYRVYQARCKGINGERVCLNIDLTKSFVFFEENQTI